MTVKLNTDEWDLDALRADWQAQDARLDATLRLDTARVRERLTRRVASRLRRLWWGATLGLLTLVPLLLALGAFIGEHRAEPRFLAPAVLLLLGSIASGVTLARQLVIQTALSPDAPVVSLQSRLATLRRERLHAAVVALAVGPLLWVPALIVLLRGWLGVDLYAVASGAWIVANLAFGLLVIAGAALVARHYRRAGTTPPNALLALLAGHTMGEAERFLDELAALDADVPTPRAR